MRSGEHVDDALLEAFALGTLGERTAVLVAEHVDVCPACANRVLLADPLSAAFASVDDPVVPADLVAAVLAAEPLRVPGAPWSELAVAAGLLLAAAAVAWSTVGPAAWWSEATGLARGLAALGAHAGAVPGALPALAAIAALAALAARRIAGAPGDVDA